LHLLPAALLWWRGIRSGHSRRISNFWRCNILILPKISTQFCPNFVLVLSKSNHIFPNLTNLAQKNFARGRCVCISSSYGTGSSLHPNDRPKWCAIFSKKPTNFSNCLGADSRARTSRPGTTHLCFQVNYSLLLFSLCRIIKK